ncbi:SpoIID/LytB domain-containing protein [Nocardia sp. NPDC050630]|uniref:SpoIID/LytB domain-containing protein n=1 Tax=Nocardia sp. NPDC050630 TaxID=3364321 RepID=UPI0037987F56
MSAPRGRIGRRRISGTPISIRSALLTGGAAVLAGTVFAFWVWPSDALFRPVAGPGHGRGMSQVGAFDSALAGWAAERILDHYYPGATLGKISATTVGVRLFAQDDSTLDAYADAGLRVAGQMLPRGQVAHLTALPDGGANVVVTAGCDGAVLWQRATADPWIYPLNPRPNRPAAEHLTLCDGSTYRGSLGVAMENGKARTVNRVDVEDYLLGVVPAEVQANWVDKGATEALRAQAIAARSYALAEHRYPYAQTCDSTDCQEYPGTAKEDPRASAVIASTAGTVLLRDGRILRSEYSSAPNGGEPADIYAFDVGPTPAELGTPVVGAGTPVDPRKQTLVAESPIDAEYRRIGGASSPVGQPLGPEMALPENSGIYRLFTNGVIIATPTLGARVVDFTTLMQLVPDTHAGKPPSTVPPGDNERALPPGANGAPDSAVPGGANGAAEGVLPGSAVPPGASGATESAVPGGANGSTESVQPGRTVPPGGAASVLPDSGISPDSALSGGANGAPESVVPGGPNDASESAMPGVAHGATERMQPGGTITPGGAPASMLPDGRISHDSALSGGANDAPESVGPGGNALSDSAVSDGNPLPRSATSAGDALGPRTAVSPGIPAAAGSAIAPEVSVLSVTTVAPTTASTPTPPRPRAPAIAPAAPTSEESELSEEL